MPAKQLPECRRTGGASPVPGVSVAVLTVTPGAAGKAEYLACPFPIQRD